MTANRHELIVENQGYCGGCEFCGSREEIAYCSCGADESCPGLAMNHDDGRCGSESCDCPARIS